MQMMPELEKNFRQRESDACKLAQATRLFFSTDTSYLK